jgi:hypothetical protein
MLKFQFLRTSSPGYLLLLTVFMRTGGMTACMKTELYEWRWGLGHDSTCKIWGMTVFLGVWQSLLDSMYDCVWQSFQGLGYWLGGLGMTIRTGHDYEYWVLGHIMSTGYGMIMRTGHDYEYWVWPWGLGHDYEDLVWPWGLGHDYEDWGMIRRIGVWLWGLGMIMRLGYDYEDLGGTVYGTSYTSCFMLLINKCLYMFL